MLKLESMRTCSEEIKRRNQIKMERKKSRMVRNSDVNDLNDESSYNSETSEEDFDDNN